MRREFEEGIFKAETKKDQIIRIAKEDPFLKIEEIAERVKTTKRYVRTILSEANLSLMNLREEYARKMEKQSEAKILFSIKDSLVKYDFPPNQDVAHFHYGTPRRISIQKLRKGSCITQGEGPVYQYLQTISYQQTIFGLVLYLTHMKLDEELLIFAEPGRVHSLGLEQPTAKLTSPEIESSLLSELLHNEDISSTFGNDRSVITIRMCVLDQEQIMGEEIFLFPSDLVKVTIPGFFSPILDIAK